VRDLSEIDVVKGTFRFSAFFRADYFNPSTFKKLKAMEKLEAKDLHLHRPRLVFVNADDGETLGWKASPVPLKRGVCGYSYAMWNTKFNESFELEQFPFDVQDCTVYVAHFNKSHNLPISGLVNIRTPLDEWDLLRPSISVYHERSVGITAFKMRVQRKWQWYAVNHMVTLGVLATISFGAYSIDIESFGSRLSVNLTLLLTIVATKLGLSDSLPKVPYLTVLDKYILACMALVVVNIVENVVAHQILLSGDVTQSTSESIDYAFFGFVTFCWFLFNCITVVRIKWRLESIRQTCGSPILQSPLTIPTRAHGREGSTEALVCQGIY